MKITSKIYNNISNILILTSGFIFPFQSFPIKIGDSLLDVPVILIYLAAYISILNSKNVAMKTFLTITIYIIIGIIINYYYNITPLHRIFSAMFFTIGILIILTAKNIITYDYNKLYILILTSLIISALYAIFQSFSTQFLGAPVGSLFAEPSYAGLAYYSGAVGLITVLIFSKLKKTEVFLVLLFILTLLIAAVATLSSNILTFTLVLFLILLINLNTITVFFLISFTVLFGLFLIEHEHFATRIAGFTSDPSLNVSSLTWLRSFDMMLYSIAESPVVGMGLGSTGFFNFPSELSTLLEMINEGDRNIYDAYSMAFRLIIELGLPIFLLLSFLFIRKWLFFNKFLKTKLIENINCNIPLMFLFTFSTTMLIGILIKDPTYSRSAFYLSTLLFITIDFERRNDYSLRK